MWVVDVDLSFDFVEGVYDCYVFGDWEDVVFEDVVVY